MAESADFPIGVCPDPYCRICKDSTGEIRDGMDTEPLVDDHPEWARREWRKMEIQMVFGATPREMFNG